MVTALITGGTSGIGAEFARAYARRGHRLVIVARDEARLASTADELRALGAPEVETLSADLSDRADVLAVAARIEREDAPVDILVNNAGFGVHLKLVTTDYAAVDRAFDVMNRAVFILGGAAARAMRKRRTGQIINVSSTAGFITMGAYSAIKAWVTSYTEGLSNELRGTGVTATALCPGWVRTEFHARAGITASSIPEAMWVDAAYTVDVAMRAADKGRVIVIPSARYAVLIFLVRHIPRVTVRWVSRKLSSNRDSESSPTASSTGAGTH